MIWYGWVYNYNAIVDICSQNQLFLKIKPRIHTLKKVSFKTSNHLEWGVEKEINYIIYHAQNKFSKESLAVVEWHERYA